MQSSTQLDDFWRTLLSHFWESVQSSKIGSLTYEWLHYMTNLPASFCCGFARVKGYVNIRHKGSFVIYWIYCWQFKTILSRKQQCEIRKSDRLYFCQIILFMNDVFILNQLFTGIITLCRELKQKKKQTLIIDCYKIHCTKISLICEFYDWLLYFVQAENWK